MARPSKQTIAALLDEHARLQLRAIDIEAKRERELEPHRLAYERKTAGIVEAAQARLTPIQERMRVLAGEITAQLMAGVDEKAETVALSEVVVELETTRSIAAVVEKLNHAEGSTPRTSESGKPLVVAVAQVDSKPGNRQIDPQAFFKHTPVAKRDSGFWQCLKVLMAGADKFLGKTNADRLAGAPKVFSVSISLKP